MIEVSETMHFSELSPEAKAIAIERNKYAVLRGMVDMETPIMALLEMLKPSYTASCLQLCFYQLDTETLRVIQ